MRSRDGERHVNRSRARGAGRAGGSACGECRDARSLCNRGTVDPLLTDEEATTCP